jgi:hypothetical protein
MDRRLISENDPGDDEGEYISWCFGLIRARKRKTTLEEQPAVDIIERLYALMRAKKAQMSQYVTDEQGERTFAKYHATRDPPNLEVARSHMRLALAARKIHTQEQLKYESLAMLASRLENARQTLSHSQSVLATAKTLQEIVESMPDAAEVMDALRDQLELVQEHDAILSEPLEQSQQFDEAVLDEAIKSPPIVDLVPKGKTKKRELTKVEI